MSGVARDRSRSPVRSTSETKEETTSPTTRLPPNLPASLTITKKELPGRIIAARPVSPPRPGPPGLPSPGLQHLLAEPQLSLPGLPSSADLLQQAHALQFLAQLQSLAMLNPLLSQPPHQVSNTVERPACPMLCGICEENIWHSGAAPRLNCRGEITLLGRHAAWLENCGGQAVICPVCQYTSHTPLTPQ